MESVILHRETSAVDGVWKPRRAHYGDVEELLKLHLSCFDEEDHLMVLLGRGFLKAAYRWMIPWPRAFILVVNDAEGTGKLTGAITVTDVEYNVPLVLHCLPAMLLALLRKPRLLGRAELWERARMLWQTKRSARRQARVAHVVATLVDPAYRRRGLGTFLKREAMRVSRQRGSEKLRTGIRKVNQSSVRLNEKCGFELVPELETKRMIFMEADLVNPQSAGSTMGGSVSGHGG